MPKRIKKATTKEKEQILLMKSTELRKKFLDAPVVMEDSVVYAIVEGIGYPLKEIADNIIV